MAGYSIDEIKESIYAATSSDLVQSVWGPIRSYVTGEQETTEHDEDEGLLASPEEKDQIENMDNDKVAEYLREKHMSTTRFKRK